jgi:hypothetical protein
MRLEFQRKSLDYNLDGSLRGTVVTLGNIENSHVPILLPGDQTALGNQELFELALEKHYQENFPQRAENDKFGIIEGKIAEIDAATARSKEQYAKVEEMMKMTTAMVNELIVSLMDVEDNETTN